MIATNTWKYFEFRNKTNAIFDEMVLTSALLWYEPKPKRQVKTITMYGKYPAVSVGKDKLHIHRLIMSYLKGRTLKRNEYVNHIDENKLNSLAGNLELLSAYEHQSLTNKGRKQTPEWIEKRITKTANAKRGKKYPKKIYENPDLLDIEERKI